MATVLVAVAQQAIARWIADCLQTRGHEPLVACAEHEALTALMLVQVDPVIVWPESLAANFCRPARGFPGSGCVPILFLAAGSSPWYEPYIPGFTAGLDGIVSIPVAPERLAAAVESLLQHCRS